MSGLYYTPSSQERFDELKEAAIEVWKEYDNTYGYVDEKVGKIEGMGNVGDNFMYIVAMFDSQNQSKLSGMLSEVTRKEVADRIRDSGTPDSYNQFI